jgi:hypothetical protein
MAGRRLAFLHLFLQELQQELGEGGYFQAEEETSYPSVGHNQEYVR